ncbi:MAG TPA: pyruvate formate lyase family protein, partial [Armatimonadota bacterium]|nr:pyruvate formate lyase family protein [Armatimonadota bacterium]
MNDRIERLKAQVLAREYRQYRRDVSKSILDECSKGHLTWVQRSARLIHRLCEAQEVVIPADERIVFTLTTGKALQAPVPQRDEERITQAGKWIYSPINNICADWQMVLSQGLLGRRHVAVETQQRLANDAEAVEFCTCAIETIDAILALAARYADTARELGKSDLADILSWVPAHAPRGFQEALQALRLCHSMIWLSGHHHVGLGRFDQYMWPYLQADLEAGRLDIEEAEELLAEFFISLNKDTDLYSGVQQGDNGQSLMLGGVKRDGSDAVNELTHMVLRVSRDLSMIDPKINLRVNANTDLELLKLATELTKKGLGFPQYSNDDVVIPALVAHGY